jgi:hypothetical protein
MLRNLGRGHTETRYPFVQPILFHPECDLEAFFTTVFPKMEAMLQKGCISALSSSQLGFEFRDHNHRHQSLRRAARGSKETARRAGMRTARRATIDRIAATPKKLVGSAGFTP